MVYPKDWKCPNCRRKNDDRKTCSNCKFKFDLHYPSMWHCPECGALVQNSRDCEECDYPNDLHYPKLWHCNTCNKLIKSSTKCPYCSKKKKKKIKINKNVLIFSALVLVLILLVMNIDVSVPIQNIVFNTSTISITFPNWEIVEESGDSIKLFYEEGLKSIYFFNSNVRFSEISSELYNIFYQINDEFNITVYDEYSFFDWEVICFSGDYVELDSCISATICNNKVYYLQYTDYTLQLNKEDLNSIISSFCCNC